MIMKQQWIEHSSNRTRYIPKNKEDIFYYLTVSRFRQEVQGYGHEMRRWYEEKRVIKKKAS